MSNKSIGSKIQSLEEKLKAENESRGREDTLSNNVGRNASPRAATSGPPRPMAMSNKPRLRHQLDLQVPAYQPRSKDSVETENQLRAIKLSGILTIDSKQYQLHIKDLEQLGELGNGTCGHVVKMLYKPSGDVIAVKQMRRSGNSDENKRILMDLDVVLHSHGCPYIVRYLGCFITEADVWICMELMASCFDKILKKLRGPIPEDILGKVTVATVKALSYLKEVHGVIHRDVKPSNILVDERGVIKLCDFGISGRLVDSKAKTRSAGCAAYMAPERIDPPDPQKPDYDIRADVWSLGISLVELATGIFPYRNCQNEFDILTKVIAEEPPKLPENQIFSLDFKNFVHSCLIKNYRHRPKYAALLADPFMQRASESDVRVDQWLASLNNAASPVSPSAHQRSATSPVARRHRVPPESVDLFHHQPPSPISPPLFNGSDARLASPSTPVGDREKPPTVAETHPKKSPDPQPETPAMTPETPEHSLTVLPKSPPTVILDKFNKRNIEDHANEINHAKTEIPTDDCDSGSFGSMNIDDVTVASSENLSDAKRWEEASEKGGRFRPIDKPHRRDVHRHYVFAGGNASDRGGLVPLAADSPADRFRGRSFSNASADPDRDPHERPHRFDRFAAGSPKGPFANLEPRNQPFSGGGFESRRPSSRGPDSGEFSSGGFHPYGSPEVHRRHFFSPCRPRDCEGESHPRRPIASVFRGGTEAYENVPETGFSPPRFRTDAPTSYFTSTAVCSVSRYFPPTVSGQTTGPAYHHNPGGSCSQPASLEAYGDGRHYPPYSHTRGPDKIHSPALWSPQPVARRAFHTAASREREERDRDRWRNNDSAHQHHQQVQVQGNTSPIVLQRFYHQQSQRRSRRDVRDGSPHHSSLSREASVGRSPEPPRRLNRDRDASLSRVDIPPSPADRPLSRERRERDRTPADMEGGSSLSERDVRPDLIKPHRRHDRHSQDSRDNDCSMPSLESDRESLPPAARERFHGHHRRERERKSERNGDIHRSDRDNDASEAEPIGLRERFELRSQKESSQLRRERERKAETNGDSQRSDREDNCDKESLSTARERFELKMQEKKNHKGAYSHHPRERDKTDDADGEACERDGNGRVGPPQHRHGKSHSKDKDEQGTAAQPRCRHRGAVRNRGASPRPPCPLDPPNLTFTRT